MLLPQWHAISARSLRDLYSIVVSVAGFAKYLLHAVRREGVSVQLLVVVDLL